MGKDEHGGRLGQRQTGVGDELGELLDGGELCPVGQDG
jgi:hypothetical protein